MTADVWRKRLDYLRRSRRVIAIDPCGQGRSGGHDADVSPEGRAANLAALLDRLGLERVVLLGWSLGVKIARSRSVATFGGRK
ncbi:alpha/beta fold hydrolase [Sphingopyxis sp. JAI128]|uniref:alpha/beta fold hydrolase n=1 Tax=Sphingopyxis sp. JAI128 TaxID=2723066 RepID=UPI001617B400|nr:alpha/beta fold hydrolase [Sphingopyxis sp. JAI128]MBB6427023.1 pimeloyl-ACP methyl ester carboxylesterase [Sphingopyxis sp. JAI128]